MSEVSKSVEAEYCRFCRAREWAYLGRGRSYLRWPADVDREETVFHFAICAEWSFTDRDNTDGAAHLFHEADREYLRTCDSCGAVGCRLDETRRDIWENEPTLTTVRRFGLCRHTAGLSIRETVTILELLGAQCSLGGVWQWVHRLTDRDSNPPTVERSRVLGRRDRCPDWCRVGLAICGVGLDSLDMVDTDVFSR